MGGKRMGVGPHTHSYQNTAGTSHKEDNMQLASQDEAALDRHTSDGVVESAETAVVSQAHTRTVGAAQKGGQYQGLVPLAHQYVRPSILQPRQQACLVALRQSKSIRRAHDNMKLLQLAVTKK